MKSYTYLLKALFALMKWSNSGPNSAIDPKNPARIGTCDLSEPYYRPSFKYITNKTRLLFWTSLWCASSPNNLTCFLTNKKLMANLASIFVIVNNKRLISVPVCWPIRWGSANRNQFEQSKVDWLSIQSTSIWITTKNCCFYLKGIPPMQQHISINHGKLNLCNGQHVAQFNA